MPLTIYHNPRCTKSRQTLDLLTAKGLKPTVVEYLKRPPSVAELTRIIAMLGVPARNILRKAEANDAAINPGLMTEKELIEAMEQALAHAQGSEVCGMRVHRVVVLDAAEVRAIRARTGLSRTRFAERFGLDVRAVQDWEQGRRVPDRAVSDRAVLHAVLDAGLVAHVAVVEHVRQAFGAGTFAG